jgi:NodT family efflux transporter outer membrane factor (OMF) lipoprotein
MHMLLCGIAVALLSACASKPQPVPAVAALPATWAAPALKDAALPSPTEDWWSALGDRQLDAWVRQAWNDSAEVSVLVARLDQVRASRDAADSERRPRIDVSASAGRERVPQSSLRVGGGDEQMLVPPYRQSRFTAQLEGRYEIDLLGRLAQGQKAASANLAAGEADLRALRQWLAAEVVQAYVQLRHAEYDIAAAQLEQSLLEQLLQAERARLAAGLVARDTPRQVERQLAQKRDEGLELERQRHLAWVRLAALVGKPASDLPIEADASWMSQRNLQTALLPDLPAEVIGRRADVQAAWQRVQATAATAERTRLERYPSLTLTGNGGFASTALRRWLRGDALAWLAQAAMQAPLFDGGRQQARTDEAAGVLKEAQAQYRKQVLQALGEVESALFTVQSAHEREALARAEVERRELDLATTEAARSAGTATRLASVQAELARVQAGTQLQARRFERLSAWAQAQRTLGR